MYEANSKTSKCNSEVSKSDGEHNRLLVINEIVASKKDHCQFRMGGRPVSYAREPGLYLYEQTCQRDRG